MHIKIEMKTTFKNINNHTLDCELYYLVILVKQEEED